MYAIFAFILICLISFVIFVFKQNAKLKNDVIILQNQYEVQAKITHDVHKNAIDAEKYGQKIAQKIILASKSEQSEISDVIQKISCEFKNFSNLNNEC